MCICVCACVCVYVSVCVGYTLGDVVAVTNLRALTERIAAVAAARRR